MTTPQQLVARFNSVLHASPAARKVIAKAAGDYLNNHEPGADITAAIGDFFAAIASPEAIALCDYVDAHGDIPANYKNRRERKY